MGLLEREQYLAGLNAALAEAQAGAGRLALVSGEAGIGKTSLVEWFTNSRRSHVPVLWGACDALFSPRPFGPLYDMAGQLPGVQSKLFDPQTNRSSIFSIVLSELQRRTLIIVFEDLHWADDATFDLLRFLGRRIIQTRSLMVFTYRDDELGSQHPLRTLLGDLVSSPATRRISLPPLSKLAVKSLVLDRKLDASALHLRTGGNPFFVTEVLASADGSIPVTVRDAVLARAARLTPSGYAVLEAAAVIGPRVEPWLLTAVTAEDAAAIDESVARGMLLTQGNVLAFRHELARHVILETISPARRRHLHYSVLKLLASSPLTGDDKARLAHHAEAAGDRQAVLEYAPTAARQASAASAHRESAALYDLALCYASDLPLREHAQLLQEYAQECNSIDNRKLGIQILRKALDLWRELDDPIHQGAVLAIMANMLIGLGKDDEAMHCAREAIAILETHSPGRELAYAYRVQGNLALVDMDLPASLAWSEKSLLISEGLADTSEYLMAQAVRGCALMYLDYERGCRHMEETLAAAVSADRRTVVAFAYANLGSISSELHHFQRAEQYLKEGLAYVFNHDLDRLKFYMMAWLAFTHLNMGLWQKAGEAASIVLRDAHRSITSRMTALITLGRLRARRGDPQANLLLDEALELSTDMGAIDRLGLIRTARAEAAWLAGDQKKTMEEARAVYDLAVRRQHPWYGGELTFWRWMAGDKPSPTAWMARPYTLLMAGNWREAAQEWERLGCPYERAVALAEGDLDARIAALEIFERLGARPSAEKLRQILQVVEVDRLPRRPRLSTLENPFGLTHRQVEILSLLTEDLTNAEIAARLHISPKTADHHVSAILEKLNVHSRESAATLARQNPRFGKMEDPQL
jgi:DNA-binding CsgD family transcriptional regulator/tetratricopeptide (TPR) repeat protein